MGETPKKTEIKNGVKKNHHKYRNTADHIDLRVP